MRRIKPAAAAFWISVVILAAMLVLIGFHRPPGDADEQENLLRAVERAAVQCYALEGEYPMSVKYLEQHYGVSYDSKKYFVSYSAFGSNIRPIVQVLPAPG